MPCAGLQLLTNMALFLGAELFKAQAAGHVLQSLNQWLLLVSRRARQLDSSRAFARPCKALAV